MAAGRLGLIVAIAAVMRTGKPTNTTPTIRTALLLLTLGSMGACVMDDPEEPMITLDFVGNGSGSITVLFNPIDGEDQQSIDCSESCSFTAAEDSLIQILPTAADGSNFLGWNRNFLGDECRGTGHCDFVLYGEYLLEVDFSNTRAAIEIESTQPGIRVEYSGDSVRREGESGAGHCYAPGCLLIADLDSEVTLRTDSLEDSYIQWSEFGVCDAVQCVVPFSNSEEQILSVTSNKWLGIHIVEGEAPPL